VVAGIRQKEHVDDAMMAKAAGIRGDIQYVTPDAYRTIGVPVCISRRGGAGRSEKRPKPQGQELQATST
jgi:hypothetical protein